jgi:hypothetical protein
MKKERKMKEYFLGPHDMDAKLSNNLDDPLRHNVAGPLNRPAIYKRDTVEDEPFVIGKAYFDTREDCEVTPVRFYGNKVEITTGQACNIEYAKEFWEEIK